MNPLQLQVSNQYPALVAPEKAVQRLFHALEDSRAFPIAGGELSVVFVDDATIADVHKKYMSDPTPTDVITFPANAEMGFAGEIIVSVDHARRRSEELGEPFNRELSLYLIHGWLHLAGYDDHSENDRAAMRAAERKAFTIIGQASVDLNYKLQVPEGL